MTGGLELQAPPDRFSVEPIRAWRNWFAYTDGRLRSVNHDFWWPGYEAAIARCRGATAPLYQARVHGGEIRLHCTCGIWAYRDRLEPEENTDRWHQNAWPTLGRKEAHVYGSVSIWGRVFEHERGWRAARAYPYEVVVRQRVDLDVEPLARLIRDTYAVDVVVEPLA